MANEVTVPLLPCRDVDEIAAFYGVLGFRVTYRQQRPNPYVALRREDLHLHFFGMPDFDPATSYGSCLVLVDDIGALHRSFADAMRAAYGKVLVAGLPRMTRPRVRKNMDGLTGFSIVDPGGNWIRVTASRAVTPEVREGRLARALQNAVVLADSKGDHVQAVKILDGALAKADQDDDAAVMVEALAYRAELALVLDDPATAEQALARARELDTTGAELAELAEALEQRRQGTVPG
jgi:catechol 2,3-dioxygenase-like lactoylglutathione lyase family enzyme